MEMSVKLTTADISFVTVGVVVNVSYCNLGGDSLQLEDGQAVQLEDGTTAYIHTPKGKNMFNT